MLINTSLNLLDLASLVGLMASVGLNAAQVDGSTSASHRSLPAAVAPLPAPLATITVAVLPVPHVMESSDLRLPIGTPIIIGCPVIAADIYQTEEPRPTAEPAAPRGTVSTRDLLIAAALVREVPNGLLPGHITELAGITNALAEHRFTRRPAHLDTAFDLVQLATSLPPAADVPLAATAPLGTGPTHPLVPATGPRPRSWRSCWPRRIAPVDPAAN